MSTTYRNIPDSGSPSWKDPVATYTDLPLIGNEDGDARITLDSQIIYVWIPNMWLATTTGGTGPVLTVTASSPLSSTGGTGPNISLTGIVSIPHGGTGHDTAQAAFDALSPMTTAGDIIYEDSTPEASRLSIGADGQVLTVSGGLPAWVDAAATGVTSVGLADTSTSPIYSISNTPITSSGTIDITLLSQSAHQVLIGPASGSATQPTFRSLSASDIPSLGYVTSVALNTPNIFSVSGSPITSSGTLAINLVAESANQIWAGPTSGSAANPAFRALVTADLPAGTGTVTSVGLNAPNIFSVSGTPVTSSGTLALNLVAESPNTIWAGPASGSISSVPTFRTLTGSDLPAVANELVWVSSLGSDVTGNGSYFAPYASVQHALTSITDNSSTKPYTVIITPGSYGVGSGINLKPWIFLNAIGQLGSVILQDGVGLNSSWSSVTGDTGIAGCILSGNVLLDLHTIGGGSTHTATIYINSCQLIGGTTEFLARTQNDSLNVLDTILTQGILIEGGANLINNCPISNGSIIFNDTNMGAGDQCQLFLSNSPNGGAFGNTFTYGGHAQFGIYVTITGSPNAGTTSVTGSLTTYLTDATSIPVGGLTLSGSPNITYLDDANGLAYTPGVPGNWSPAPTLVQGALDQLAATKKSGTVTSVSLADTSSIPIYSVSGVPITSSGTIDLILKTQSAHQVLIGPSSGSPAQPTFRVLSSSDIPSLNYVTSVGLSAPSIFSVSGSPITSSGTLALNLVAESANTVWAGPTSGAAVNPSFRALVASDIPSLSYVNSLAAVGNSPNANAGVISVNTLTLEPADATHPGVLTALAQSVGGIKTFTSNPIVFGTASNAQIQLVNNFTSRASTDGLIIGIDSSGNSYIDNQEDTTFTLSNDNNAAITITPFPVPTLPNSIVLGTTPSSFTSLSMLDVSQNISFIGGGLQVGVAIFPTVDTDTDGAGVYYGMAIQPTTPNGANGFQALVGTIFAVDNTNSGNNSETLGLQLLATYSGGGTSAVVHGAEYSSDGGNATTDTASGVFFEPANVDGGATSGQFGTALFVSGTLSIAPAQDNTSAGTVNALPVPNSFIYLDASTTITLNGITDAYYGKYVELYNATGNAMTINNNSASAAVGEKILTPSGIATTVLSKHTARLRYYGTPGSGNWLLLLD